MKSLVVGTAGHIDHGKSALVQALTGTDPDRLAEEKRRGITIDLGFAHRELRLADGEPLRLSLVDVPGHERFVRNMLAGAGGLDLVLLVIAANEGVMPQTLEHFEICRLVGLRYGVVALTKSDLVSGEDMARRREEVRELVQGSFLEGAVVLPVSSRTGTGLAELEAALVAAASGAVSRSQDLPARLPVDRVFTLRGFGAVVTGTLISGRIAAGAELELWAADGPSRRVRVRAVQVHDRPAAEAVAGERTALNLAGIEAASLARGMLVAEAGVFRPSRRWDVAVHLIPGAPALPLRTPVRLHLHTAETIAQLVWSGPPPWAQLLLRQPLPAVAGDHFILRRLSPAATLGGGVVVDPAAERAGRESRAARLERLAAADARRQLEIRAEAAGRSGLDLAVCAAALGRRSATVRAWAVEAQQAGTAVPAGQKLWTAAAWAQWEGEVIAALEAFHRAEPLIPGISPEALVSRLGAPRPAPALLRAVLERLAAAGQAERHGELWRRPGRGAELGAEESAARQRIEAAFLTAGFRAPAAAEVLAGAGIDPRRADKILRLLVRDGVLLLLTPELLLHRDALGQLRQLLAARRNRGPRLSVADFKTLAGVTRKHAIPLLEYLDRIHVTRRIGDEREILP